MEDIMFPTGNLLKRCTGECGQELPLGGFPRNKNKADGHDNECKTCKNKRSRTRYATGPGFEYELKRKYNITLREYHEMYRRQQGKCAVCGLRFEEEGVTPVVDHNHQTNEVRGLLCSPCNTSEGLLGGDPQRAISLAKYIVSNGRIQEGVRRP